MWKKHIKESYYLGDKLCIFASLKNLVQLRNVILFMNALLLWVASVCQLSFEQPQGPHNIVFPPFQIVSADSSVVSDNVSQCAEVEGGGRPPPYQ